MSLTIRKNESKSYYLLVCEHTQSTRNVARAYAIDVESENENEVRDEFDEKTRANKRDIVDNSIIYCFRDYQISAEYLRDEINEFGFDEFEGDSITKQQIVNALNRGEDAVLFIVETVTDAELKDVQKEYDEVCETAEEERGDFGDSSLSVMELEILSDDDEVWLKGDGGCWYDDRDEDLSGDEGVGFGDDDELNLDFEYGADTGSQLVYRLRITAS